MSDTSDSLNNLQNILESNRKEMQNVFWPDLEKKVKVMRLLTLQPFQAKTTLQKKKKPDL